MQNQIGSFQSKIITQFLFGHVEVSLSVGNNAVVSITMIPKGAFTSDPARNLRDI